MRSDFFLKKLVQVGPITNDEGKNVCRRERHVRNLFSNCFSGCGQTRRQGEATKEVSILACGE